MDYIIVKLHFYFDNNIRTQPSSVWILQQVLLSAYLLSWTASTPATLWRPLSAQRTRDMCWKPRCSHIYITLWLQQHFPICWGQIYRGQMRVVFLQSEWRWHVGMLLLLFCFQSKVSSWWMCFPAPYSPRAFHSSCSQLHSICPGGGTITEREGEFLAADVYVCDTECVYACKSVYTWLLPVTLWLMLSILPWPKAGVTSFYPPTRLYWGSRWPIKKAHRFRIL